MPELNLEFAFQVSDDELADLAEVLDCEPEDLAEAIVHLASAALRSRIADLLGSQWTPAAMAQLLEQLMAAGAFDDMPPTEADIRRLFGTDTLRASRALQRLQRQPRLRAESRKGLEKVFDSLAMPAEGSKDFELPRWVADRFNRILADSASTPQLRRKAGTDGLYTIERSAYDVVKKSFAKDDA